MAQDRWAIVLDVGVAVLMKGKNPVLLTGTAGTRERMAAITAVAEEQVAAGWEVDNLMSLARGSFDAPMEPEHLR